MCTLSCRVHVSMFFDVVLNSIVILLTHALVWHLSLRVHANAMGHSGENRSKI